MSGYTYLRELKLKNLKDRYETALRNAERFSHNPGLVDTFLGYAIDLEQRIKEYKV